MRNSTREIFSRTFPDLYKIPEPHGESDSVEDGAGVEGNVGDCEPEDKARPSSQQTEMLPDEAEPEGEGSCTHEPPPDPNLETYAMRMQDIKDQSENDVARANVMEHYLVDACAKAVEDEVKCLTQADLDYTPMWRSSGLPTKPSHLHVDNVKIKELDLLDPKGVTTSIQAHRTKEELQPPRTFTYDDTSIAPHYTAPTATVLLKADLSQKKLETLRSHGKSQKQICTWHTLSNDELQEKQEASECRRRAMSKRMSAAQFSIEKKIIESMQHKLSFLKNPRHRDQHKNESHSKKQRPKWGVQQPSRCAPLTSSLTSKPDTIFLVEPETIEFSNYEVGGVYEIEVALRNVSNASRRIHLLPPASQYFFVSLVKFPANHGMVAPGMACTIILRFCPDSLADYTDSFAIVSQAGRYQYPIAARRSTPSLELLNNILVRTIALGTCSSSVIRTVNAGGDGNFRIIPEEFWPERIAEAPRDVARVGAFAIEPVFLFVPHGKEMVFNIIFSPETAGEHSGFVFLVCDNCQVQKFEIRGDCQEVDVQVSTIDGQAPHEGDLQSPLWFSEVSPGATHVRSMVIKNSTDLLFSFKWKVSKFPALTSSPEDQWPRGNQSINLNTKSLLDGKPVSFSISPSCGEINAQESITFSATFEPLYLGSFAGWAKLLVDKQHSAATPENEEARKQHPDCAHEVVSIEMLGLGVMCPVALEPCHVSFIGSITLGESQCQEIHIKNLGDAPAHYRFTNTNSALKFTPEEGTAPPQSDTQIAVWVTGIDLGKINQMVVCEVENGPRLTCSVLATIVGPIVEIRDAQIDFGLVRWGHENTQQVRLQNLSASCGAEWVMEECSEESCKEGGVSLAPSSGRIPASGFGNLDAKCQYFVEGKVKGLLRCCTVNGGHIQHIRYFADVDRPKVIASCSSINLGLVYIGVPVVCEITLTNTSRVSAAYGWDDNVLVDSEYMSVTMSSQTGELLPGCSQSVQAIFLPLQTKQAAEIIISCDTAEAEDPASISVVSEIHDLNTGICFIAMDKYTDVKEANIATEEEQKHFPFGESEYPCGRTQMRSSPMVDLGQHVPLGNTVEMAILVKNYGGITAPVHVWLEEFGTDQSNEDQQDASLTRTSPRSGTTCRYSSKQRATLSLSRDHERACPFHSGSGNAIMKQRTQEQKMDKLFCGRGLVISINPEKGTLLPFQTLMISLLCKNNMCGEYMDRLHVQVGDLPLVSFSVRIGVVGTPFHLQSERALVRGFMGNSSCTRLRRGFGQVLKGGIVEKHFHTFNLGSVAMHLDWSIMTCDESNPQAYLQLFPETPRLRAIVHAKGEPIPGPFEVFPNLKAVSAGSSSRFTVRYSALNVGVSCAYLVGSQKVVGSSADIPITLKMCETSNQDCPVASILSGGFHPHAAGPPVPLYMIYVDLKAECVEPHLDPEPHTESHLNVHSIHPPKTHPSYVRTVTYCNKLICPLVFSISTYGPFRFVHSAVSVPQNAQDFQGLPGAPKILSKDTMLVPAKESIDITVRLHPEKHVTQSDHELKGGISIAYTNGAVQMIPMTATILYPKLVPSHQVLDFGIVHIASPKALQLVISNPSIVTANWSISQDSKYSDRKLENSDGVQQIGCFSIDPPSGSLDARDLTSVRKRHLIITFSPACDLDYEEKIEFICKRGQGCEVILKGKGSLYETEEVKGKLYRI